MKQSEWKDHIEFIEAEMLKRGSKQGAPEILSSLAQDYPQQFIIFLQNPIHLYPMLL